jgi:hypothetical protein
MLTFHGVASLGLMSAAVIVAAVMLFQLWWGWGVAYLVICAAGSTVILYGYCAKCPCRNHCSHLLPGKAAAVFKHRPPGPYTGLEFIATGLSLLLMIGFPQPWLWRYPGFFIAFWAMMIIALIQIRTTVCRACGNAYCPGNRPVSFIPD